MISDGELKELCDKSYAIDPMKQDSRRPQTNKSIYIGDTKFKVIQAISRSETGFQGMIVAPVVSDHQIDYSHVTVVYAGTNSKDIKDINQDVQTFGMGSQSGQVQDANTMADYAMRIAKEHGHDHVEFSGHALGGGLALYEAARKEQAARTFSAADPWNALS